MPRAIALVRVSSEAQAGADRGGVPRQREVIETIASRHSLEIVEWFVLEGVSGAAVLSDPGFQTFLRRLADPTIEGAVVAETSRLIRPEKLSDYVILEAFREAGKLLWTPEGPRDLRLFGDRLLSVLSHELDAEDRRRITVRTWGAKELMRKAGRHPNSAISLPFAIDYQNERRSDGTVRGAWSYRWPEAGIVRSLFERFVAGETNLTSLATSLGIDRCRARDLLLNPIYRGVRRIDQRSVKKRNVPRAPDDVIERRVIEQQLVSDDVWWAANAMLRDRTRAPIHSWPYSGLLVCAVCGYSMYSTAVRPHGDFYRCKKSSHARKELRGCPTGQIKRAGVESACDGAIVDELPSPQRLTQMLAAALAQGESPEAADEAAGAAKRIGQLERERARVLLAYERGMRTVDDAERRVRQINGEVDVLRAIAAQEPRRRSASVREIADSLAGVFAAWESLGDDEKRTLLRPSVKALHVARTGPGRAAVPAVELWLPDLLPPGDVDLWSPVATSRPWVLVRLAA